VIISGEAQKRRERRLIFRDAVREVIEAGHAPIAPHWLAFGLYLDDNSPEEREMGMRVGIRMLRLVASANPATDKCLGLYRLCPPGELKNPVKPPQAWVYGYVTEPTDTRTIEVDGRYVSEGMAREIKLARELGLHVEWR
jgi:hypothetical protein